MTEAALVDAALAHLASDGFIAYPTETVWGLGACADRPRAIDRLIEWKGRASNAPMSLLVSSVRDAALLGCALEGDAARLAEAFWPGPLTIVVPSAKRFADGVGGEEGALGLRCSTHPLARALAVDLAARKMGPLTSTSLNRSGEPPARTRADAEALLAERGGADGPLLVIGDTDAGDESPSTVVDCTQTRVRILRAGAIDSARIEAVLADAPSASSSTHSSASSPQEIRR